MEFSTGKRKTHDVAKVWACLPEKTRATDGLVASYRKPGDKFRHPQFCGLGAGVILAGMVGWLGHRRPALAASIGRRFRDPRVAVGAATLVGALAVSVLHPLFFPHYFAAYACVLAFLILRGLIALSRWSIRGRAIGPLAVAFLMTGGLVASLEFPAKVVHDHRNKPRQPYGAAGKARSRTRKLLVTTKAGDCGSPMWVMIRRCWLPTRRNQLATRRSLPVLSERA
jgi:hypothetical protein